MEKEKKIEVIVDRKFHQELFNLLGEPLAFFSPRLCHNVKGIKCFTFRPADFPKTDADIFTEMTGHNGISEDPTRTLYRWHWDTAKIESYDTTTYSNGQEVLCIPLTDFIKYEYPLENIIKKFNLKVPEKVIAKKEVKEKKKVKKEVKESAEKTITQMKDSLVSDLTILELCEYVTYRLKNFITNDYK